MSFLEWIVVKSGEYILPLLVVVAISGWVYKKLKNRNNPAVQKKKYRSFRMGAINEDE